MNVEEKLNLYTYKEPSYELLDRQISLSDFLCENEYKKNSGVWEKEVETKDEVTIMIVGDLLCQENMIRGFQTKDGRFDFKPCFDFVRATFKSADFVVGNLETPISETAPYRGEILTHEGPFFCNAPIEYLSALKYAGFDMLTTANNHTLDAGARGLLETIENVNNMGFIQTGTFDEEKPKFEIVNICGIKVGFTAFSFNYNLMHTNLNEKGKETLINTYTKKSAQKIFEEMKAMGAEYTVCFPHWGKEFTSILSKAQLKASKELTEIGYDFVAGSHAHVVQRFEYVNEKPVIFSLGNLVSHINGLGKRKLDERYPVICVLKLKRDGNGIIPDISFIPCEIRKTHNQIPFRVLPMCANIPYDREVNSRKAIIIGNVERMINYPEKLTNTSFMIDEKALEELLDTLKDRAMLDDVYSEITKNPGYIYLDSSEDVDLLEKGVLKYKINENDAEVKHVCSASSVVRVPAAVEEHPVTKINTNGSINENTKILYLNNSIKCICRNALSGYSSLESVRLFKNLEVIEDCAFENCKNLTGIILPITLERLGNGVFRNCTKLLSVKIPPSVTEIGEGVFEGCNKVTIYCEEGSFAHSYAIEHNIPYKLMPLINGGKGTMKLFGNKKRTYTPPASVVELQEIVNNDPKWMKKVEFQHNKRLVPMLRPTDKKLTPEQEDEILRFWDEKTNGVYRPDLTWYQFYYSRTGIESPEFIDNTLSYYFLVDEFNDQKYANLKDKGYVGKFFSEVKQPETVAINIRGYYYDKNYNMISKDEFMKLCVSCGSDIVIKPSYGTSGGVGISFVKKEALESEFEKVIKEFDSDYIIQIAIKQHEKLMEIAPNSVNTIRLLTYFVDGEVIPVTAALRMGVGEAKVDNLHFGGVACSIDKNGCCSKFAIDGKGNMYPSHPDTGYVFENTIIPSYDKAVELATKMHEKLPMFGHIGWDIAIDENGDAVLIEFNLWYAQLALFQIGNGPMWGENFDKILNMILRKAHVEFTQNGLVLQAFKDRVRVSKINASVSGKVRIPETSVGRPVTSIMGSVCSKNKNIEELELPPVKYIGKKAFVNCKTLTKVIIGDAPVQIDNFAFSGCEKLKKVVFNGDAKYISNNAFKGCKKVTLYGKAGSYVEEYAKNNGLSFKVLD